MKIKTTKTAKFFIAATLVTVTALSSVAIAKTNTITNTNSNPTELIMCATCQLTLEDFNYLEANGYSHMLSTPTGGVTTCDWVFNASNSFGGNAGSAANAGNVGSGIIGHDDLNE